MTTNAAKRAEVSQSMTMKLLHWVQLNVGPDRRVKKSTTDIGKALGTSHATIHRALAELEADNYVSVDRSTHPLTVTLLKGTVAAQNSAASEAERLITEARSLMVRMEQYVAGVAEENARLQAVANIWIGLAPHLESEMALPQPDGTYELILKFKGLTDVPTLKS